MLCFKSVLLIFVATLSIPGIADATCKDPKTQMEMNLCAQGEFEREDKALNNAYQKYRAGLSDNEKEMLKEAQLYWVKFRDSSCKFESSAVEGGSMQPMVYSMCLTDYTRRRLERIDALSKCKLMPNPGKGCAS